MTEYKKVLQDGSIVLVDTQFQTMTTMLYMDENDEDPTVITMRETLEMLAFLETLKPELIVERERVKSLVRHEPRVEQLFPED